MRFVLAILASVFSLSAAQFNPVSPGGLTSIRETNIVVTHGGSQTIPGPAAIAALIASASAGGSTNGLVIGWDYTEAPGTFSFSHPTGPTNLATFLSQGRYTIRVSSTNGAYYNDATFFVFVTDQGVTNFIPTVVLTGPPNGSTFTAPVDITLVADAQDKDGSITNLTFYNGPTPLGTLTAPPWQLTVSNAAATNYAFGAIVTDNRGATNHSPWHSVVVEAGSVTPIPPMVSVTSPTNGTAFTAPVTINLVASASDSDGSIASVTLVDNDVTNAVVTVPPYSVSLTPSVGSHIVRAIATDNAGLQSVASIDFTVTEAPANVLPTIALTAPSNGATFTAPANVSISATASDSDGSVSLVRFFLNGSQLTSDTSSPYSFVVSNVVAGTHEIYAQAVDNQSAIVTSTTNTITITEPVGVPPSVTLDSPTNGTVVLTGSSITLTATPTDDGSITNVSFYRISPENVEGPADFSEINDDGSGVVYAGAWTDNNSASNRRNNDEHYSQSTTASATFTFTGTQVAWRGTKFTNRGNADVFLDNVYVATVDEYSPTVEYEQELYTVSGLTNASHTLKIVCKGTKNASSTGFFVDVDYFEYGVPSVIQQQVKTFIVADTVAPYTQSFVPPSGSHEIIAQAWDNLGLYSTSAPPAIIVVNALQPPFVALTSPTNHQTFSAGATIAMTADASDSDGTVTNVAFWQYQPDVFITSDQTAPYSGSWTNVPAGDYSMVVEAHDNHGQISTSTAIHIHILSATNTVYVDAGPAKTSQLSVYQPYFDAEYLAQSNSFKATASAGTGQSLYDIQAVLEGTLGMYEATLQTNYLNRVLLWTEAIMAAATITDFQGRKNWRGLWNSGWASTNIAYVLEETQGATGMLRASKIVLQDLRLRSIWGSRAEAIYAFVRDHVVNKNWFTPRNWVNHYTDQYNNTSAQAGDKPLIMARLLLDLKTCSTILANSDNATYGYPALANMAAGGIKDYNGRETRFTPWQGGLVWSRGKLWQNGYYVMDTAHAERLAAVVYDFYKAGTVIDQAILLGTCKLFALPTASTIWNDDVNNPMFRNFIDGGNGYFLNREPWRNGMIMKGWVLLSEFDTNVMIACKAMMRFVAGTGSNPSQSYNDSSLGRTALSGCLAKAVSYSEIPPYAILNGVVIGSGVTGTNWTKVAGGGTATIISPNSASTVVLFGTNAVGTSTFRLTVTSGGPQISDDVTVSVLSAPAL